MKDILVPVSPGDLLDRLSILRIKSERITDRAKRQNVMEEHRLLLEVAATHIPNDPQVGELSDRLYEINSDLWEIEDDLRRFEEKSEFGPAFVALARAVYVTNDQRADLKRQINLRLGSRIVEEKFYKSGG